MAHEVETQELSSSVRFKLGHLGLYFQDIYKVS